jgi:multicomponent Na+:H+ antiporter subunit D
LVQEGIHLGEHGVVAVAIVVSLLTLFSMMKIWSGVFWGDRVGLGPGARRGMRLVTGGVALASIAVAVLASDLIDVSVKAARGLLESGGI